LEVLAQAQADDRVLLTFDKDFGELAFGAGLPASCGVVLFRLSARSPAQVIRVIVAALESRTDWAGHFSVVEDDQIRLTPLPARR
jgi:predicted nuclease of predicted toxin-antitoxin system